MARPPAGPTARDERITIRLSSSMLRLANQLRGEESISAFIRRLIAAEARSSRKVDR